MSPQQARHDNAARTGLIVKMQAGKRPSKPDASGVFCEAATMGDDANIGNAKKQSVCLLCDAGVVRSRLG